MPAHHGFVRRFASGAAPADCIGRASGRLLHTHTLATMKHLNTLSVGMRHLWLAALSGLAVVVCVAVGLGTAHKLTQNSKTAFVSKDVVADILPPPMYLIELRLVLSQAAEGSLALPDATREVARLRQEYEARVAHWQAHPPFGLERDLLGAQHREAQAFLQAADAVLAQVAAADPAAARQALAQAHQRYLAHRAGVDVTVRSSSTLASTAMADFATTVGAADVRLAVILVLSLLGVGGFAWLISRSIVQPLKHAVNVAEAVAAGDLTRVSRVEGRDEPAQLLAALNRMCASLASVVSEVRHSSQHVASASTQIAAGNADLQARTQTHQHELHTTQATLRSVTELAQHNARAADEVEALVQHSLDAATQGVSAVAHVGATMEAITASSSKVGDFVGLVQQIAFQTNLLALNAAVEAARAGEQGKGFAVVAAEVRQLAVRSARAADEIKLLVESSRGQVEDGNRRTEAARDAIAQMVDQVHRTHALMQSIRETSSAQGASIGSLDRAVDGLSASAESNVALVAQTSGLAVALEADAGSLAGVVRTFQLPGDDAPVALLAN